MTQRKRFIAGAVCPACQSRDSLAIWREGDDDVVECVKCHYHMRKNDKTPPADDHPLPLRNKERVIGVFHPD